MADDENRREVEILKAVLLDTVDLAERKLSIYRAALSAIDSGAVLINGGGGFRRMFLQLTEEAGPITALEAARHQALKSVFGSMEALGTA